MGEEWVWVRLVIKCLSADDEINVVRYIPKPLPCVALGKRITSVSTVLQRVEILYPLPVGSASQEEYSGQRMTLHPLTASTNY